jgi:hypothetical protein
MEELDVIELYIDDEDFNGIDAISLVQFPAIEENFVALSQHKIEFKTIDVEKRVIIGLALVPDKEIYRRKGDYEYKIKFSKDTVKKGAYLFLKNFKSNNATIEHETTIKGVYVVESWLVDNPEMDKTKQYGLNATEGAWAVVMKIDNDDAWEGVKNGDYLGLSIEGFFSDKLEMNKEVLEDKLTEQEVSWLEQIKDILKDV